MKIPNLLHHVKGHKDDHGRQSDIPLEAQLNCLHDNLANMAVVDEVIEGVKTRQKLPLESACIFTSKKETTDMAKGLRHYIGKEKSKKCFCRERDHGSRHLQHYQLG